MEILEKPSAVLPAMAMTIALADVSRADASTNAMQTRSDAASVQPDAFAGDAGAFSLDMARPKQAPAPEAAGAELRAVVNQDKA